MYRPGTHFSYATCQTSALIASILQQCIIVAVSIISIVRVYILFDRERWLLATLIILFVCSIAMTWLAIMMHASKFRYDALCLSSFAPKATVIAWIMPVVFEAMLCIFVLVKFMQSRRRGLGDQPILTVLIRDGIWPFGLILAVDLLAILFHSVFEEPLSAGFNFWAMSVYSFAGSHVLLNLRRVAIPVTNHSTAANTSQTELELGVSSDLVFGASMPAPNEIELSEDLNMQDNPEQS
ncbi:uncharacterized protein LAESUDRAFT_810021 [Laetiporus sulphureus 93-53]|uniref:Uncharacterized protein n=1 Tax=Laetiporus sulphureus 93-53 TaxID=1314785 RepID=A0A165GHM4_9APHY|nr:uncharacterized protein LAESUDRAFT_810021 [Laetiporus sulphureus 93-53]KZT10360.1 hypothetical protein LAESUDRAFT_810021 [Laetiporus sulphureus 93-53]